MLKNLKNKGRLGILLAAAALAASGEVRAQGRSSAGQSGQPGQMQTLRRTRDGRGTVITRELADLIVRTAGEQGLDPLLVLEVMRQESAFRARARSPKNAGGLMQLIPATAARFGVTDPMDPHQAIAGGCRYLRHLWDRFGGDVALVLAGYNAGEGAVEKYGRMVPPYPETINYVRAIIAKYRQALATRGRVEQALRARAQAVGARPAAAALALRRRAQAADVERLNRIGRMGRRH